MGVRPGEVVSYLLPNGVAAASVFLGAMCGGFVVSPISMLAQDAHRRAQRSRTPETRVVLCRAGVRRAPRSDRRAHRRPRDRSADLAGWAPRCRGSPSAPPRRCLRSARDAGAADVHVGHDRTAEGRAAVAREPACTPGARSRRRTRLTSADRVLSSLPLYHVNGQCIATISPARIRAAAS